LPKVSCRAFVPESPEYNFNFCLLQAAGHRFPEAIPECEKAVELWGGNEPQSLSMLAAMYSEVGRLSDAAGHGEPLPWRQLKMMCPFLRTFALESPTMSGK
jgi:hypothetical protein